MFDAVVVTLCVETVANRAALVVRIKDSAPVHCTLSSSLSADADAEEGAAASKRAPVSDAKGAADLSSKKKKTR